MTRARSTHPEVEGAARCWLLRLARPDAPEGLGIIDHQPVGIQRQIGLEAAEEAFIGDDAAGGAPPVAAVALRDRAEGELGQLDIGDAEGRVLTLLEIEAAQRQGIGEWRGRDIDIEASRELRQLAMLRVPPIALAVRFDVALAAAVQIIPTEGLSKRLASTVFAARKVNSWWARCMGLRV